MDTQNHQPTDREAQRALANREELVERVGRAIPEDGVIRMRSGGWKKGALMV